MERGGYWLRNIEDFDENQQKKLDRLVRNLSFLSDRNYLTDVSLYEEKRMKPLRDARQRQKTGHRKKDGKRLEKLKEELAKKGRVDLVPNTWRTRLLWFGTLASPERIDGHGF